MMRNSAFLLVTSAAMLLFSSVAYADPAATSAAPAATSTSNPDEVVCRNNPPPTGSRLGGGRECHTQREWDQRQKDAQQATMMGEMKGLAGVGGSGGGH
ncbi:MAG: hypothetical protein ABSD74_18975 [Rhizomicrobium sp.]|jgi:hypothetical protein